MACLLLLFVSKIKAGDTPHDRIGVHDPVLIKQDSTYYLFTTGRGVSVWSSEDLMSWNRESPIFNKTPVWTTDSLSSFRGHFWAPDISFHNGKYYLYYSVSAFGKNTSCIGLATNKTLNPKDPEFYWEDHGAVICSTPNKDNWNAIDPNLIVSEDGVPYLFFGSFWDGLQVVRLTDDFKNCYLGDVPTTIASRKSDRRAENPQAIDNNPIDAGGNAIEAPFVFKKDDFYYLFSSIDYCCKGIESTYKMIYGRSKNIKGPYFDKNGRDMLYGGGTILMKGDEKWHGVGHNAVIEDENINYLIFHGYDAQDEGKSKLRIYNLTWDEEKWPQIQNSIY